MALGATIKKIINKYPVLKNKYFLVGIAFFIWLMFIDSNNIILQIERLKEKKHLQTTNDFLNQNINFFESQLYLLKTDINFVEKIGREKYRLKKDNEDIFIIDTTFHNKKK